MKLLYQLFYKLVFLGLVCFIADISQADIFVFEGLSRTRESWVREYLALDESHQYSAFELEQLKKHLLTTGAFTKVELKVISDWNKRQPHHHEKTETNPEKESPGSDTSLCSGPKYSASGFGTTKSREQLICIGVEEKWTTLPVLRGEFGGGTPLRVLGIYDIHTFGSLITTGAEFRQYGSSDPGFVAWAKAPRFKDGRYSLGTEIWKDIRMRTIYDSSGLALGEFEERASRLRVFYFHPLNQNSLKARILSRSSHDSKDSIDQKNSGSNSSLGTHQAGFDLHIYKQNPTIFKPLKYGASSPFSFETKSELGARLYLTTIFDNITIDQYDYDGLRNILRLGVDLNGKFVSEIQTFGYALFSDLNLATHFTLQNRSGSDLSEQRFLGGFDGIRGFKDGAQVGPKSWQWNNEVKWNLLRTSQVWLMAAGFIDTGRAGQHLEIKDGISSTGFGIRIASPKIYRLMLRLDHGWAIDGSKQKGFSIGLNDFFQPYRPL